jgi:hypothetical protein
MAEQMSPEERQSRIAELQREAAAAEATASITKKRETADSLLVKARKLHCDAYVLLANPNPGGMGQPSKFSSAVLVKLLEAYELGATDDIACSYAAIGEETFYGWMRKARAGEPGYSDFSDHIQRLIGNAGLEALKAWRAHYLEDFKAPRDFLARRFYRSWSPTIKQQVTTDAKPAQSLTIVIQGADAVQLSELMQHSRAFLAPAADESEVIDGTAREIETAGEE